MSNNAVPFANAEMQQFQDDLLQSVREYNTGQFSAVTLILPTIIDRSNFVYCSVIKVQ